MRELVQGVHRFQSSVFSERKALFEKLAGGQNPHTLFITCADSRIDPTLLTQMGPGDLFILRNAGNLVPAYGREYGAEAAGIEYALAALGVEHIVICGHSHCGAMTALIDPKSAEGLPAVEDWLTHAAATRRLVVDNYPDHAPEELLNVTIQENVLMQLENLRTHPMVASRLASGRLRLHGWVYKIETGEVFAFHPDVGQFEPVRDFEPESKPRLASNLASVL
jgi:carbonic anhydrase